MSELISGLLLPPGLILIVGAFLLPQLQGKARAALVLLLPVLTLVLIWTIPDGSAVIFPLMDYALEPVSSTPEGRLFATIFAITAFAGGLYALNKATTVELGAAFFYAGSAIGVTFAGDLITLFIYWEMMALGSTLVVWANGAKNARAYPASMRYLLIHLLGGVLLMAGIAAHVLESGSIAFVSMAELDTVGKWLIISGFLLNAGAPPLSAWIADAYPEASASGTVFLSAFTTKTAVFALLMGFAGADILIYIGLYMVVYGIVYATLENDMRRMLAYSIVAHVGFMVVAVGVGSDMARNAVAAYAYAHILSKGLLLMSAGSVMMMTGKQKLTELGGLFQTMPVTTIAAMIGALTISAFPFTAGFVTKPLGTGAVAYAAAEQGDLMIWAWLVLMASAAAVGLHAGIKYPWFTFFHKDAGLRPTDPEPSMQYAMWFFSFLCIGLGLFPEVLYNLLPYQQDVLTHAKSYQQYTPSHLLGQLQLLFFAGFAFFILLPWVKPALTISLDVDWFYRRLFHLLGSRFTLKTSATRDKLEHKVRGRIERAIRQLHEQHGPQGYLGRSWPSGSMVLWVAVLLTVSLGLYYVR